MNGGPVIPVIWVSYHAPTIIPRGYWDQAFIEGLFDGTVWAPPCGYEFLHLLHTPGHGKPSDALQRAREVAGGAVVVIPGRHHANRVDVGRILAELDRLDWSLPIVTGDEAGTFPVDRLEWPWVMADKPYPKAGWNLGSGFAPHLRPALREVGYQEATLDYSFAGQVNHARREQCVDALRRWDSTDRGLVFVSGGFTQGLKPPEYAALLGKTRIVPCPSGRHTPDTFRFYEALEAGALPLVDGASPLGGDAGSYWCDMFGGNAPFPVSDDWTRLGDDLDVLLTLPDDGYWKRAANRAGSWWQLEKRRTAHALHSAIEARGATDRQPSCDCDRVTVLIPTSPIPAHPSTDVISETIRSVRACLPHAKILVMADGVRPEQAHRAGDYEEYLRRLIWDGNHRWSNVAVIRFDEHQHQANMTRRALELVDTPAVMFVEHDTPLLDDRQTDWTGIIDAVVQHRADVVRLAHEEALHPDHAHLLVDGPECEPMTDGGADGVQTRQWSQRPHVARTAYYRNLIAEHFPLSCSTMIEDKMHSVAQSQPWERNRIWIYTPVWDRSGIKRSRDLDGRGADPKYPMDFGR